MPQDARSKTPVICLHGFPGLASHWNALAAALPDDRPFHSVPMPWLHDSAAPARGFRDVLTHIATVTTAANLGPAHFVGHDLGGVALFWLAQTGFRRMISSATFIASPHPESYSAFMTPDRHAPRARYIDTILSSHDDARLCETLNAAVTGADRAILPEIEAGLAATNFPALRSLYAEIHHSAATVAGHAAGSLGCPVAVVHCAEDRFLPADLMADSVARFGPRASALTLDGDSHYPHLTASGHLAAYAEGFWNDAET